MGHGHTACRGQVHELALGSLVAHGAQQKMFAVPQHIRSFTTDQGVEADLVTEGIETALALLAFNFLEMWSRTV